MSLTFVSLGLHDAKDITVRGLEAVKFADVVYLEHYTSVLQISVEELEEFYNKKIIIASRLDVEGDDNIILRDAIKKNVVLLIVGDVFSATTHSDLYLRAHERKIALNVVHNASILTAVGVTGLQLYKFGKTTSLVFFEPDWKPQTAYNYIKDNKEAGLHTLCLLDIKTSEPKKSDLAKQHFVPQPPRYMSINQALEQLLQIELERGEGVILPETLVVAVARLGSPNEFIKFGTVEELKKIEFGGPLHSLIIPGKLHFHEEEMLQIWK
jgi:diphthine methyl ester synthase